MSQPLKEGPLKPKLPNDKGGNIVIKTLTKHMDATLAFGLLARCRALLRCREFVIDPGEFPSLPPLRQHHLLPSRR